MVVKESIYEVLTYLFAGGGLISLLTIRSMRKKSNAEANMAGAEADGAIIRNQKEIVDMYKLLQRDAKEQYKELYESTKRQLEDIIKKHNERIKELETRVEELLKELKEEKIKNASLREIVDAASDCSEDSPECPVRVMAKEYNR